MKQKIKIIFFDIDWTLYDHKNQCFNMPSIEKINELKAQGIKIFLCTARPYHSALHLGTFDFLQPDGYIVSNGGAVIVDNNKVIKSSFFKKEDMDKIYELVNNKNLAIEVVDVFDRYLITEKTKEIDILFSSFKEIIPPFRKYDGFPCLAALLFAGEEYDQYFLTNLPKSVHYKRFADYGVDIVPDEREKGGAIKSVLEYYNIPKECAMAFGDDYQDISMFENVGVSICLGNGKEEVKKHATFVTEEIWNDGVKIALEKYKDLF
ncbi:MAG: HAD family hydrolase [Bacilli bacterium]